MLTNVRQIFRHAVPEDKVPYITYDVNQAKITLKVCFGLQIVFSVVGELLPDEKEGHGAVNDCVDTKIEEKFFD